MRIALGLEYDGSPFCGWQTQPSGCGVQDHLERALFEFTRERCETTAAGRTDTGVHAAAQVVHFDTTVEREIHSWVRGTNANLDRSARVVWAKPVDAEFHARYGARERTYRYLLADAPVAPAILRGKVGWHPRPLDVDLMRRAAQCLVGEHDFTAFRDAECQAKSPVRMMARLQIRRRGPLVDFTLVANAFLHHMVRNIVGTLVYVGDGRKPGDWVAEILEGRDRNLAAPTFSAEGLYLAAIGYDPAVSLPSFPSHPLLDA